MESNATLTIDLKAIEHNIKAIKNSLPKTTLICPVVKDDCYQMGAVKIVKKLIDIGISDFAVSNIYEAVELKEQFGDVDILILGRILPDAFKKAIEKNIILSVTTIEEAILIDNEAKKLNRKARVHIKLDTGMNRIGFKEESLGGENYLEVFKFKNLNIEGIFSHFATADENLEYVDFQLNRFKDALKKLPDEHRNIIKHINNSASLICSYPEIFDMVRPGIILYGIDISCIKGKEHLSLKNAIELKAKLIHIKDVYPGEYIGYSNNFKAKTRLKVGTISIGYGDGYDRRLSNKGSVIINGKKAPIIGNICMDQLMVDLSNINDLKLYQDVYLIGNSGGETISVNELSQMIDDIPYTFMCGINKRVKRIYIE